MSRLVDSSEGVSAIVSIDLPETRVYFDDGRFRNSNPAREDLRFTVSMRPETEVSGTGRKAVRTTTYALIGFSIS